MQDKYSVRFDSSNEVVQVALAEGASDWRGATKRHEVEAAQSGGIVPNPEARKSRGEIKCDVQCLRHNRARPIILRTSCLYFLKSEVGTGIHRAWGRCCHSMEGMGHQG